VCNHQKLKPEYTADLGWCINLWASLILLGGTQKTLRINPDFALAHYHFGDGYYTQEN
jgi:hypothetical protein